MIDVRETEQGGKGSYARNTPLIDDWDGMGGLKGTFTGRGMDAAGFGGMARAGRGSVWL